MSLLEIGPVIFGSTESPINYLRRHHILADHLITLALVIELDIALFGRNAGCNETVANNIHIASLEHVLWCS